MKRQLQRAFIYCGKGAARVSMLQMGKLLEQFFPIEWIFPSDVKRGLWKKEALLFAMPGGADLCYCRDLLGEGNREIRSFVEEGGVYLGICAGAYYAGSFVEFDKGGELEVLGARELCFFPKTVQGPAFGPFGYHGEIGAKAIRLTTAFSDGGVTSFYHGGGLFCEAEGLGGVEVLARYEESAQAAIVLCSVGRGAALLSGAHFEIESEAVESSAIAEVLKSTQEERRAFIRSLFERLPIGGNCKTLRR